jgi:peptidylprolyl isomerase
MDKPRKLRLSLAGLILLVALIAVVMSVTLRGGTRVVDLKVGTGPAVKAGDMVVVHYVGRLADGTVFDDSKSRGTPFDIVVGKGSVIEGWEIGLIGMRAGGSRRLIIPPEEGYGEKGAGGVIPPDATLYFEIDLLKIK